MFGLSKIWIYGIAALIVVAAVGGFFAYQRSIVSSLENTIKEKEAEIGTLKEQVAGLIIDNEKLKTSNDSLEKEIDRRAAEVLKVYEDLDKLRREDTASRSRLIELERKVADQERVKQLDRIRESRKASLLLKIINDNIKCEVANFEKVGLGKCVNGRFVPN